MRAGRWVLLTILMAGSAWGQTPGTILTIAGTGRPGFLGDGGSAAAAQLNGPTRVAVDLAGDVFVLDSPSGPAGPLIRKINRNGEITTLAGGGQLSLQGTLQSASPLPGSELALNGATGGLAVGEAGDVLFTVGSCSAWRLTPDGNVTVAFTVCSPTGQPDSGMWIRSVASDPTGGIVAYMQHAVTNDGVTQTSAMIQRINGAGSFFHATVLDGSAPMNPTAFAVGPQGTVVTTTSDHHAILRATQDGQVTPILDHGTVQQPDIDVSGLVVDRYGDLFISDRAHHRVLELGTDGILLPIAGNGMADFGGDGGPARIASLDAPAGLAIDSAGNLFLADAGNNRIREVVGVATRPVLGGDVNGDGRVGVADATLLLRWVLGLTQLSDDSLARADVAGTGNLNIADVTLILRRALGLG